MRIVESKKEKEVIKLALAVLKKGGVVIYPTETCYGIGGDATSPKAVKKVLEFKGGQRGGPGSKPISIAVSDKEMAKKYVVINKTADNLYREFLPGPLTVVSKSRGRAVGILEADKGTLGIRIPKYPLVVKIIKEFGRPITSTSANASGKKTPYCLKDVLKYTSEKRLKLIDLFIDGDCLPFHFPSTVVDTTLNEPTILRRGEIEILETKSNSFISDSEEKTKEIAKKIIKKYSKLLSRKALIFALQGELGSGKTQFAKGLGSFLKIKENIISPTFVIIREYPFKLEKKQGIFFHLDTWRLEKGEELLDLGLKKMFEPGNVIAIEWLQKIKPTLDNLQRQNKIKLIWISIKYLTETKRKINYK